MVPLHTDAALDLFDRHGGSAGQDLREVALIGGFQVLDENESHSRFSRQGREKREAGFQAAGRCADADDGEMSRLPVSFGARVGGQRVLHSDCTERSGAEESVPAVAARMEVWYCLGRRQYRFTIPLPAVTALFRRGKVIAVEVPPAVSRPFNCMTFPRGGHGSS